MTILGIILRAFVSRLCETDWATIKGRGKQKTIGAANGTSENAPLVEARVAALFRELVDVACAWFGC